jgi:hypothetical protein
MAGIRQPIQDILTLLATLQVTNGDAQTVPLYSRIWNNQFKYEEQGKTYDYPKPAAFLEVINKAEYRTVGTLFQSCDVGFKVHLIHEFYNNDVTLEQDLLIFDLRDQIVALLSGVQVTACGPLERTGEYQEYDHTNVYHYIIDFITNFTDSKSSQYDPAAGKYIYSAPPTNLNLVVTEAVGGSNDLIQRQFNIQ